MSNYENRSALNALRGVKSALNQNQIFLLFAWVSGIIVWFYLPIGGWFVGLALVWWLYKGFKNSHFIDPNLLNLPVAGFLLTALVGVWAAYNPQAAFHKFLIIVAGGLIFMALTELEPDKITWFFGLVSLTGLFLAGYFLLSNDWIANPADFGPINQIGQAWMAIRLNVPSIFDNANIPAGILGVMLPFIAAFTWFAHTKSYRGRRWLGWLSLVSVGVAIFLSSSRAVWGVLLLGLGVWAWWEICYRGADRFKWNPRLLFLSTTVIAAAAWLYYITYVLAQNHTIASVVPGDASAIIRAKLYHQTTDLIPDFWLTGGGLQSFAGLYSEYILDIPYLYFKYAHNLWLDIALEQGLLGILSFLVIFGLSMVMLIRRLTQASSLPKPERAILISLLVSSFVFIGHGFVDDAFYGVAGTPFLFIIPGLLVSLEHKGLPVVEVVRQSHPISKILNEHQVLAGLVILVGVVIGFVTIPAMKGAVLANLGAVKMAKLELAGFPLNTWEDGLSGSDFNNESKLFQAVLANDPDQRTSNHCLGRIALQAGEYDEAVKFLKTAHEVDPNHTGIQKTLGFAYVWTGDFDQAYGMIARYPEAITELDRYYYWWQIKGKPTLSANASQMIEYMRTKK